MRKGTWVLLAGGVVVAVLGVWVWVGLAKPTDAEIYLDKVIVRGYQQTATSSGTWPGSTDATGTYIGPAQADLGSVIVGPGVKLAPISDQAAAGLKPQPDDLTDWVARGDMAGGCGLLVEKFRKDKTPDPAWSIPASAIPRVRTGALEVLRVTVVCGSG